MIKAIENAIQSVKGSYPSIYSKDDVINLLYELMSSIDDEVKTIIDFEDLKSKLHDAIEKRLNRMSNDNAIEFESAEFSINYDNRVELDNVNLNVDSIVDEIDDTIDDILSVYEEVLSDESKTEAN